jgi:hypothetical protein
MGFRSSSDRKLHYAMLNMVYNQPHAFFNLVRSNVELTERFLDLVQDVYLLEQKEKEGRPLHIAQEQCPKDQEPFAEAGDEDEDEDDNFHVKLLQDHEAKEDPFRPLTGRKRTTER